MLIFPSREKNWVWMKIVQLQHSGAFIYKDEKFLALRWLFKIQEFVDDDQLILQNSVLQIYTTEFLRPHNIEVLFFFVFLSRPPKIPQASFLNSLPYLYLFVKCKY